MGKTTSDILKCKEISNLFVPCGHQDFITDCVIHDCIYTDYWVMTVVGFASPIHSACISENENSKNINA